MKTKVLSVLLILTLAVGLFPLNVFAGGDIFSIKFEYQEYSDSGELLRTTVDLLTDGVLESTIYTNEEYKTYDFPAEFAFEKPDGGEVTLSVTASASQLKSGSYSLMFFAYMPDDDIQPGLYTLITDLAPNGYKMVKPSTFTVTQENIDDYNGPLGFAEINCDIEITKSGSAPTPAPVSASVAVPTASTVLVNGENVAFDAYNINGNNYFKLRDLAYAINGSEKQFEVGWDGANNAISLTSNQPYTPVGGEMQSSGTGDKTPAPTNSKITLDGIEIAFTAYNIDGNNYFKLRDIGAAFDFGITWDGANNTIVIDTSIGYTPE